MKLVDITNTNPQLVQNQLNNTDATLVKVYTYGPTTIILSKAAHHIEILYRNKRRNIKQNEIEDTLPQLLKPYNLDLQQADPIKLDGYVEISIPC